MNLKQNNITKNKNTTFPSNEMLSTFRYIEEQFRNYYSSTEIHPPPRYSRREWAFTFFGKSFMLRHKAFSRWKELVSFLKQRTPSGVYYSSAYYRHPDAAKMKDKEWLGADLIFDLDADHIEGADRMSFGDMLDRVKEEFMKLIYDFLMPDFGFEEKEMDIVFSGGRGYHLHVYRYDVLQLKSAERREIVDYITARGLDPMSFVEKIPVGINRPGSRFSNVKYTYRLPSIYEPGWRGKLTREVVSIARSFEDKDEAMKRLTSLDGVGKKTAHSIISELFDTPTGREKFEALKEGNVDVFSSNRMLNAFLKLAFREAKIRLGGETDEPVTSDIKRLIRMPGSLHGKTGFRVVPLTLRELEDFDPLMDAVVLPEHPVSVRIIADIEGRVKDETFSFRKGDKVEVPVFLAVFLAGRKAAFISTDGH